MAFLQLCEETEVSPWVSGCKTLVALPEGSVSHLVHGGSHGAKPQTREQPLFKFNRKGNLNL